MAPGAAVLGIAGIAVEDDLANPPVSRVAVVDGDVEEDFLVLLRFEAKGLEGHRGLQRIAFAVEIGQHDAPGGKLLRRVAEIDVDAVGLRAANQHLAVGILGRPALRQVLMPDEQLDGVAVPDILGLLRILQRRGIGDLDEQVEVRVVPGEAEGGLETLGVAALHQAVGADPQGRNRQANGPANRRA